MCISINLDVPVVTHDQHEIGIARDIICASPGAHGPSGGSVLSAFDSAGDLWLRVSRAAAPDLFIPFAEIAETRSDGVQLRASRDQLAVFGWERLPSSVKVPA